MEWSGVKEMNERKGGGREERKEKRKGREEIEGREMKGYETKVIRKMNIQAGTIVCMDDKESE